MTDQGPGTGDQGWTPPPPGGQPPPPPAGPPPGTWQPPPATGPAPGWQPPGPQTGQPWAPTGAPPSNGMSGCLKAFLIVLGLFVVLGIVGAALLVFAGNKVVDEIQKSTGPAASSDYDIHEGACSVSETGTIQAEGTITNTSGKKQGFDVEYRFVGPDHVQLSVDSAVTDSIPRGGTAKYTVVGLTENVPKGSTCELSGVSYTIFDNEGGN